jgi:superfamily II DNA helicase RecQ
LALHLIRKTGEGKSDVVLALATVLCGITLVLVPLIKLGCDQVAKGFLINQLLEAYHLDEHQGNDHILLSDRLLSITDKQAQSIILFTSPQSLQKSSIWFPLFEVLSNTKLCSLFVIDEAHSICL